QSGSESREAPRFIEAAWLAARDDLGGSVVALEDLAIVGFQPVLEHPGVDAAEVEVEFQVAVVEVREGGVVAEEAGADHRASEKHRGGGAVVGAGGAVL